MEDADLEAAAEAARVGRLPRRRPELLGRRAAARARGACATSSSSCSRREVEREVRLGDPLDDATTMGPVNNEPGAEKMDRHVADAVERGATRRHRRQPRGRLPDRPLLAADRARRRPARLDRGHRGDLRADRARSSASRSLEQAIEQTNAQSYGLMAAIFTADLARRACATRTRSTWGSSTSTRRPTTGSRTCPGAATPALESGIGRVGGAHPMDTLTELQTVLFKA